MAITYTATLNPGAVSVANANWSDAAGFNHGGSAPKLLVRVGGENQTISGDLDQSGATPACDLIHFMGGIPRVVGTGQAPLIVKFDATYTTEPNLIWDCDGGVLYIEANTNACVLAVFTGRGTINIQDGEFQRIIVDGPTVNVAGAADISTEAIVRRGHLYAASSSDTLPTLRVSGPGTARIERRIETALYMVGNCDVVQYNTTGSATATVYHDGGIYRPELGDATAYIRNGPGFVDTDAARGSVTIGGTTLTNYGPGAAQSTKGLVTFGGGTTTDYGKYTSGNTGSSGLLFGAG